LNESERPIIQPHSQGTVALFKLFRTAIYFLHMGLSYLLMLAVMSFNVGVFLATVLGLAVGYAFFLLRLDPTDGAQDLVTHHH
jgi:copper transporter 1